MLSQNIIFNAHNFSVYTFMLAYFKAWIDLIAPKGKYINKMNATVLLSIPWDVDT